MRRYFTPLALVLIAGCCACPPESFAQDGFSLDPAGLLESNSNRPDSPDRVARPPEDEPPASDELLGQNDLLEGGDLLAGDDLLGGGDLLGEDDLLGGGVIDGSGDPLHGLGPTMNANEAIANTPPAVDPHESIWTENCYPSAETCRKCHPGQYDQWRASGHAYAAVSPMFHRFEQAMIEYTRGTVGYFCVRCHLPVGTQLKVPRASSVLDAPPVVREGVTCIACHRIREHYWRSNGDRRIEPGDVYQSIGGASGGAGVADAVARRGELKLKTDPCQPGPGQPMHKSAYFFEPLTNSDVCVSCHQVAVHPGIWLEVVHAQYRSGPAARKGITCQQCHMGAVPGKPDGYEWGHVAEISGKPFGQPRKRSNHLFWGPGYSIAHPGIFPHNPQANQYTARQWLLFDYRAGWGTEAFEASIPPGTLFPPPWDNTDDRRDGRRVIDANLATLDEKRSAAVMTMEAGLDVQGPIMHDRPRVGRPLRVGYRVSNLSEGHNLPTGSLGAQPQLWLNVVLIDPDGCRVWESGYLDQNSDLADMNSAEVATGGIRRDADLFNLQTKFLINNVRGTDREVALPLNFSLDQLVLLRPGAVPITVLNHPPLIRMEAHSIPPLDHRTPNYHIPASAFRKPGAYRLSVRMRNRTEPAYFMRQIHSTADMIRRMNENMLDFKASSHTFLVK